MIQNRGSAPDGALDWLKAALADKPPGSRISLSELSAACPYDTALLYEAIGFLEREERLALSAETVFVLRHRG